jgi:hypothetical protein
MSLSRSLCNFGPGPLRVTKLIGKHDPIQSLHRGRKRQTHRGGDHYENQEEIPARMYPPSAAHHKAGFPSRYVAREFYALLTELDPVLPKAKLTLTLH